MCLTYGAKVNLKFTASWPLAPLLEKSLLSLYLLLSLLPRLPHTHACIHTHRRSHTHRQVMHARATKQGENNSADLQHDPFLLVVVNEFVGNTFPAFLNRNATYIIYWPTATGSDRFKKTETPEQIVLTYRCMCVCVLGVLKASSPPPPMKMDQYLH